MSRSADSLAPCHLPIALQPSTQSCRVICVRLGGAVAPKHRRHVLRRELLRHRLASGDQFPKTAIQPLGGAEEIHERLVLRKTIASGHGQCAKRSDDTCEEAAARGAI